MVRVSPHLHFFHQDRAGQGSFKTRYQLSLFPLGNCLQELVYSHIFERLEASGRTTSVNCHLLALRAFVQGSHGVLSFDDLGLVIFLSFVN